MKKILALLLLGFGALLPARAQTLTVSANGTSVSITKGNTYTASPVTAIALQTGQSFTFTAMATGAKALSWSATTGGACASNSGGTCVYTAGQTPGSFAVIATLATSPNIRASFPVTITGTAPPPVTVSISPATVTLAAGAMQQFTATVTNSTAATTWTASCGSVTSTGLYTAPSAAGACAVTATNSGVSASATVTVTSSGGGGGTVVYNDSFTSTADLNKNWCNTGNPAACPQNNAATAITCPSGIGFTLTTCADMHVTGGGNNLLVPCFVANTAGCPSNGFNLAALTQWFLYEEIDVTAGANFGTGNFKFIYNKNSASGGSVGVCYYDGIVNSENPLNVALRTICDTPDQPGTYVNVNLTLGAKHVLEEQYQQGVGFTIWFDNIDIGTFPSGVNLGSQAMTDTEIGLYLNNQPGSAFDVIMSNFKICTVQRCPQ